MLGRILNGVERTYLIRAWLIGACFFALMVTVALQAKNGAQFAPLFYFAICTLMFPFSKLVWDELKNLVMGQNIFLMNALILMMLKLFINALLWAFAPFIAIIGIGYIWYRTKSND
ncbi:MULTISPECIES: hypothetical protein [Pseudochrobactrum]|uniref:Uncharacterized protein n=1 Tax=Pseudochrobactrum saccharolyticum TaxID=354352 RepID=A0A7W8AKC3_9HYPH|nr:MULTISPECIES: hypothetical protein [Pseudochrobactrum]KAB0537746.1 hypothetical protein F7P81_13625 [Pseudochrobactrum saccharolyticum]MBB5091865.1 hypothetical protein [Pseudochrobactrum saccharolyticum]MDP8250291.1 hypothetical protein [Pseudochrobactrum saccharolyticum]